MYYIIAVIILITPSITLAQSGSLQGLIAGIGTLINDVLIPFVIALAFLIFVFNVYRFFVLGGSNEDGRENAKNLAIYSLSAFVLIIVFWGLINFIVRTTGLETNPCENDTVSDYIISSLAPCTSIRPPARPVDIPDSTPPGGGFGTGIDTVDDPIIIPGGGTGPSSPSAPGGFTPDGTPVVYAPVKTAHDAIRASAASYFSTQINTDFGYNKDIVDSLFADLDTTYSNTTLEINRLKAALRLNELGVISNSQVNTYISAYNTYVATPGVIDSVPFNLSTVLADVSATPPAALQSRKNQTRQQLIDILTEYNLTSSTDVDITAALANAYDPNSDADTRHELMLEIFFPPARIGGSGGTQLPMNVDTKQTFIEKFTSDINTEKIYAGDFNLIE